MSSTTAVAIYISTGSTLSLWNTIKVTAKDIAMDFENISAPERASTKTYQLKTEGEKEEVVIQYVSQDF
ncbi:hypothetical protein F5Y06DRAFT_297529 [Hypoxylon sp. FL0890]|nr:hypothetical protein F5Y06DRAFT_297529 [Hypoxylon sp. FL0890]